MRTFFGRVFATVVGVMIAQILIVLFFVGIGVIALASLDYDDKITETKIKENSILHLHLSGMLKEKQGSFFDINFDTFEKDKDPKTLILTVNAIYQAADNPNVKGVYMEIDSFSLGYAQITELLEALLYFKGKDKFILAYSKSLSQKDLALMSIADERHLDPNALVMLTGLAANITMYKGLLNKLGIQMYGFKKGKFKSYTEPYVNDKLSEENRYQISTFLNDLQNEVESQVSANLSLEELDLKNIYKNWKVQLPKEALNEKLITKIAYKFDSYDILSEKLGIDKDDMKYVHVKDFNYSFYKNEHDKIAVLYIEGEISNKKKSKEGVVGYKDVLESIKKLKKNDDIKGVVVRINSPGGSAATSDLIYNRLKDLSKTKPVFASMGNVAASGGYYIACGAQKIYSGKNTITGSIGVVGLIPNFKGTADKLEIHQESVKTYKNSDFGTVLRKWRPAEMAFVQKSIDDIYDNFLSIVADARNMEVEKIHQMAQGRVWTGKRAIEKGLVDDIQSFNEVIKLVAKEAKLENFSIVEYPEPVNEFEYIMNEFMNTYVGKYFGIFNNSDLSPVLDYWDKNIGDKKFNIQMRMPYNLKIN